MASSTPRHPPCTLCPCSSSSCQGGASTLGVSPALCPGGCGAAELGCDFSPCGVNTALGLEGGFNGAKPTQRPLLALGVPTNRLGTAVVSVWALARCPGGDTPSGSVCGPPFPIPTLPLSPPMLLSPISLLPISPGLFPFPFSSSLPLLLDFPAGSQDLRALDPDTFAGSWQPLIFTGCPQPPTATLG